MNNRVKSAGKKVPWNKGKRPGQKPALSLQQVRALRRRLQSARQMRGLVLFSLAIESNLRACDLVSLRVRDVSRGRQIASRVTLRQLHLSHPVQFEITDETRGALAAWIEHEQLKPADYLFSSRIRESPHISTRQYARMVASWVSLIGLDAAAYGTQSLRRTRPALLYRRTGDLEAMQERLGHTRRTTTARFLGIQDEA